MINFTKSGIQVTRRSKRHPFERPNIPDDLEPTHQWIYIHRERPPLFIQFHETSSDSEGREGLMRCCGNWFGTISATSWKSGGTWRRNDKPGDGVLIVNFRYYAPSEKMFTKTLRWDGEMDCYVSRNVSMVPQKVSMMYWNQVIHPEIVDVGELRLDARIVAPPDEAVASQVLKLLHGDEDDRDSESA